MSYDQEYNKQLIYEIDCLYVNDSDPDTGIKKNIIEATYRHIHILIPPLAQGGDRGQS